jgi:hypothetical protein
MYTAVGAMTFVQLSGFETCFRNQRVILCTWLLLEAVRCCVRLYREENK